MLKLVYNFLVKYKVLQGMGKPKKKPTTRKPKTKPRGQKPKRASNGQLLECGNPKGRPKGSKNRYSIAELWAAIQKVERKKKRKLLEAFVDQAYGNPTIMVALMKKVFPDLKSVEGILGILESSMSDELAEAIQNKLRKRML